VRREELGVQEKAAEYGRAAEYEKADGTRQIFQGRIKPADTKTPPS
jgi:hypothetical protein